MHLFLTMHVQNILMHLRFFFLGVCIYYLLQYKSGPSITYKGNGLDYSKYHASCIRVSYI